MCQPYLLGLFLDYLTDDSPDDAVPQWRGVLYAVQLVVVGFLFITFNMQAHYSGQLLGMKFRSALSTSVYRKVKEIICLVEVIR